MALTPLSSRDYQFENTDAQGHHDDQKRNAKKANWKADKTVLDYSERANCKTIQHQKPAFAICGPPNTGCDRASSCRQRELTRKRNRAIPRMENQGSIRVMHS